MHKLGDLLSRYSSHALRLLFNLREEFFLVNKFDKFLDKTNQYFTVILQLRSCNKKDYVI